ncbi:acyl-CoA thioesterase [Microlunatus soli]|uniref:Acyl-CoA thioesterase 2 n=1 Tax=Microlunatus soli TaxID=630515 RepID=A0A1H1ZQQ1_9ACTN|nr:acyl-CoA thioesterase II [Microlunatus soli]SDT36125.1 acyl-CoA thioesterase-2 [Microlunatus soli]
MPESLDELVDLLSLETIETGLYRAKQPRTALQRAFGGQVLAQALVAAGMTVPDERFAHSLHGYFLLEGRTDLPIVYDVDSVRDGGSFSTRRVTARQDGKIIFYMSTSFHRDEDGFEHADPVPENVPGPDTCPSLADVLSKITGAPAETWTTEWGALDVRYVGNSGPGGGLDDPRHPARVRIWIKADGALPDDRRLHSGVLAYASDLTLLGASLVPHGEVLGSPRVQVASIDHAMWFHRLFRADDWLLYDQVSPSASSGLGLSTARLFQQGTLVSDVAQEGLIRPARRK